VAGQRPFDTLDGHALLGGRSPDLVQEDRLKVGLAPVRREPAALAINQDEEIAAVDIAAKVEAGAGDGGLEMDRRLFLTDRPAMNLELGHADSGLPNASHGSGLKVLLDVGIGQVDDELLERRIPVAHRFNNLLTRRQLKRARQGLGQGSNQLIAVSREFSASEEQHDRFLLDEKPQMNADENLFAICVHLCSSAVPF
jgi:hypothetical protein